MPLKSAPRFPRLPPRSLANQPRRIHTFDVFDTALTRIYIEPEDALRHWAEQVSSSQSLASTTATSVLAEKTFHARMIAERAAWKASGYSNAIHISQIYEFLQKELRWTPEQTAAAIRLELSVEAEGLRAVPRLRTEIKELRAQGLPIVFISDMYLPADFIRDRLSDHGISEPSDSLFVSSESGVTKRSGGRLFSHAAKALGVSPARLTHTGDDQKADVRMAQRRRVRTRLAVSSRIGWHESAIISELPASSWREKSAAGALRLARLKMAGSEAPGSALAQLLVSTIGPLVTGYALWLLDQAASRGIDHLFFLARDMQIVAGVADRLIQARGDQVTCTYIHASRRAWQPPGYLGDDFDLAWLMDQSHDSSIRSVLARILDPTAIASTGLSFEALDARAQRRQLREILADPWVASTISNTAAEKRTTLLEYLATHGFRPDGTCAIVDAGWRGTLQKCLSRSYTSHGDDVSIPGFYLGLRHEVSQAPGSTLTAWLPGAAPESMGFSLVSLIESLLIADHGSTIGYARSASGHVLARLEASPSEELLTQHRLVSKACHAYLEEFLESPASQSSANALGHSLATPLLRLCRTPRREDALLLQGWKYDVGRDIEHLKEIASPLRFSDLGRLAGARIRRASEADTYLSAPWLRGSVAASEMARRALAGTLLSRHPRQ